jgi:hypothetical protein
MHLRRTNLVLSIQQAVLLLLQREREEGELVLARQACLLECLLPLRNS